ncbi:MAG: DUF6252 family protein [Bacteroidota bacterium]
MRKHLIYPVLCLFLWMGTACEGGFLSPGASMKVKLNDQKWKGEIFDAYLSSATNEIQIQGWDEEGQLISLRLDGITTGTYDLGETAASLMYYNFNGAIKEVSFTSNGGGAASGTVEITEIDDANQTLSGTFSGVLIRPTDNQSIEVVGGTFNNIPYKAEAIPTLENEMGAQADGTRLSFGTITATVALGKIIITGQDVTGQKLLEIVLPLSVGSGLQELAGIGSSRATYFPDGVTELISSDGELIVSNHLTGQRIIQGSFDFRAENFAGGGVVDITEGFFSVSY